jgi:hypothetical protein|tara:strand:- start:422 stop:610 length:189 start_codon:yes stop_codon:yes gene_type:complete
MAVGGTRLCLHLLIEIVLSDDAPLAFAHLKGAPNLARPLRVRLADVELDEEPVWTGFQSSGV